LSQVPYYQDFFKGYDQQRRPVSTGWFLKGKRNKAAGHKDLKLMVPEFFRKLRIARLEP
jgi:hypothetical protein